MSVAATYKEDGQNSKTKEIIQIVEEINTLCGNESKHYIFTILHSNETHHVEVDQKEQRGVKLKKFHDQCIYDAPICSIERDVITDSMGRFESSFGYETK